MYGFTNRKIKKNTGFPMKYKASFFGIVCFYSSAVYKITVALVKPGSGTVAKIRLLFAFIAFLSMLLHYVLRNKDTKKLKLLHQLEQNLKHVQFTSANETMFKNSLLTSIAILPFCLAGLHTYAFYNERIPPQRFAYGYAIEHSKLKYIPVFIYFFIDTILNISYPCYISYDLCSTLSRCGDILIQFKDTLDNHERNLSDSNILRVTKTYFVTVNIIRKIRDIFLVPISVLIMCIIMDLFTVLLLWMLLDYEVNVYRFLANMLYFVPVSGTLVAISFFGGRIPEILLKIRWVVGTLIDKYESENVENREIMFLLKRIETKDIVTVSAGEMVTINRKLILSTFGGLFTYGLLLFNMK